MGGAAMALTPEFGETSVDDLRMPHFSFLRELVLVGVVAAPIHASMSTSAVHPPFDTLPSSIPAAASRMRPKRREKGQPARQIFSCHVTPRAMIIAAVAALFLTLPMSTFLLRASASAVSDTFYMLSEGPYLDVTDMREAIQEEGG
ncbi:hypothetical protein CPAR01_11873 [Colletotrichum paranaense]|uniref:Uncharacterized protein n=1 Tax=Colletotrichum paranaense TaxID=1914294 RepID=A0ABQ9S8F1_9PEZI|nr:uncharacterized protein CPAR01_11873 [Colletotrichum paranaense]KAK1529561.1 hypothetical protein CPAR01_11873 [Colletotrichum paranaense]